MAVRKLLENGKNLILIGAPNPFIAKLVERAGFGGIYLSGAGLSNSLGVTDTGILTLNDFTYMGQKLAAVTSLPVLADADTGFKCVAQTVKEYIQAGLSGFHLEDQLFPKRCGHLAGKEVVSPEKMEEKIRIAVKVRDRLDPDFIIIARTDARGAGNIEEAKQFDEAVSRSLAYKKAGADAIFPESLRSREEFEKFRNLVAGPLLANMTEFGKTPFITAEDFFKMGYQMVIFPVSIFRYLAAQARHALETIKKDGNQKNLVSQMMTREEINKVLG